MKKILLTARKSSDLNMDKTFVECFRQTRSLLEPGESSESNLADALEDVAHAVRNLAAAVRKAEPKKAEKPLRLRKPSRRTATK